MLVVLLDGALKIEVAYSHEEDGLEDDVLMRFTENCPQDERLFGADETIICLTPREAVRLANALLAAAEISMEQREMEDSED